MAQTLCYDLARAEKAKDGKKEAPGLQALETGPLSSTKQKGKDCHDQDKQVQRLVFGFIFGI